MENRKADFRGWYLRSTECILVRGFHECLDFDGKKYWPKVNDGAVDENGVFTSPGAKDKAELTRFESDLYQADFGKYVESLRPAFESNRALALRDLVINQVLAEDAVRWRLTEVLFLVRKASLPLWGPHNKPRYFILETHAMLTDQCFRSLRKNNIVYDMLTISMSSNPGHGLGADGAYESFLGLLNMLMPKVLVCFRSLFSTTNPRVLFRVTTPITPAIRARLSITRGRMRMHISRS